MAKKKAKKVDKRSLKSVRTGKTYKTVKGRAMADIAHRAADRRSKNDSGEKK